MTFEEWWEDQDWEEGSLKDKFRECWWSGCRSGLPEKPKEDKKTKTDDNWHDRSGGSFELIGVNEWGEPEWR